MTSHDTGDQDRPSSTQGGSARRHSGRPDARESGNSAPRLQAGDSPGEIVDAFDTLKLADVYSVIGYYLRHQTEVDAYLQHVEEEAEAIRREIESQPGYQEGRERLLARRAALRDSPG